MRPYLGHLLAIFVTFFVHHVQAQVAPQLDTPCAKWTNQSLSISFIKKEVQDKKLTSVEEVLCRLPIQFLSNYVLVYNGNAAQEGSIDNFRVMLFHYVRDLTVPRQKRLRFILTFNGSPRQKKYHAIEMMEIDENRPLHDRLVVDEINFESIQTIENSVAQRKVSLFPCTSCHGQTSRGIIEAYPIWPGFLGSEEFNPKKTEIDSFNTFVAAARSHSRYKYLKNFETFYASFYEKDGHKYHFVQNNNLFNDLLLVTNYDRIVGNLRLIPGYQQQVRLSRRCLPV